MPSEITGGETVDGRKMIDGSGNEQAGRARRMPAWTTVLGLFWITSLVEGIGVSQVTAFMPLYLLQMGLSAESVPQWVGALNSLVFVLGLPLVPLWGVWADKYSRKAVIIRSALVEALVFTLVALSHTPFQLAGSLLLVGFQLGNSGVMLAALREVTPRHRLGSAIGLYGASGPIGFAAGPAIGGLIVDQLHGSLSSVFGLSAILSLGTAAMLTIGLPDVRTAARPIGRTLNLAYGALRGVFVDPTTRRLFTFFGLALLARQMSNPFLPLLVERANSTQVGLASAIALVVGTAALVGGVMSPLAGTIGDRIGFRAVLAAAMAGSGLAIGLMPLAPSVPWLAIASVAAAALNAAATAMIFGLLALEVPAERRSATINLVYLPLYITGIVGPSIGAIAASTGISVVFAVSGMVLAGGAVFVAVRGRI